MSEAPVDKDCSEVDVFIANTIYPDARAIFAGHPRPLDEVREESVVVLDTNALLAPYGVGRESLEEIQRAYEGLARSQRLVVPGQVAREFADNRAVKIRELFQQLSRKRGVASLSGGTYPLLETLDEYAELVRLEKEIDEHVRAYRKAVGKVLDRIREWRWRDPISALYSELFGDGVVVDVELDREVFLQDLAYQKRHKIPPGYKDSGKDDLGIGDLLIWRTILHVGKSRERSVIFVSGDHKPDWWIKSEGQVLYPRYELVEEFRRYSGGHSFHIVPFSAFLELFGAAQTVVKEVSAQEMAGPLWPSASSYLSSYRADRRWAFEFGTAEIYARAEPAVADWLRKRYPSARVLQPLEWDHPCAMAVSRFARFVAVAPDGSAAAFDVVCCRDDRVDVPPSSLSERANW